MVGATAATALGAAALANTAKATEVAKANQQLAQLAATQQPSSVFPAPAQSVAPVPTNTKSTSTTAAPKKVSKSTTKKSTNSSRSTTPKRTVRKTVKIKPYIPAPAPPAPSGQSNGS